MGTCSLLLHSLAALLLIAGPLHAGDKDTATPDTPEPWLTGSVELEADSRYIQSGNDSAHGKPVLSTDFELDASDFSLGLASHVALQKTYQEADAYLDYTTTDLKPVNFSLGYVYAYIVHGPEKSLHDFYTGASLAFWAHYTTALNAEADVTNTVGTFGEWLTTAKYPVVKDKVDFSPYVGIGYAYGFSSGAAVNQTGTVERVGFNVPVTLTEKWELNFQAETVFSHELDGQTWVGARVTYNF